MKVSVREGIDVPLDEFIDSINKIEMIKRWSYISQILREVDLSPDGLGNNDKRIVKNYLEHELSKF